MLRTLAATKKNQASALWNLLPKGASIGITWKEGSTRTEGAGGGVRGGKATSVHRIR